MNKLQELDQVYADYATKLALDTMMTLCDDDRARKAHQDRVKLSEIANEINRIKFNVKRMGEM
jgi:hypothetical protein